MSLRVWLPLNGNVNNQGSDNITMSGTPASYSSGKIGTAATWNGSTSDVVYNNTTDYNFTDNFSFALWICPNFTGSTSQYAFTVGRADGGGYGYGLQVASATQLRIRFGNNSVVIACNSNTWYHIAATISNAIIRVYVNGTLTATSGTTSTLPTYSDGNGLGLGCFHYLGNIYPYYGMINDFRIYDHALSAKEVKEISKGLIAHYPLDGNGKGNDNYFVNSNFYTGTTSNWGGVNGSTISIVSKDNKRCVTGTKGTSSYLFCQTLNNYSYTAGTVLTYTISLDVYVEETGTIEIHNWITTTQASGWQEMSLNKKWNSGPSLVVGWNHVSVTMSNAKHNSYSGNIITGFSYSGTTMYATNIKFEFGDIGTPWCPNSADAVYTTLGYNSTAVIDTSGYKNNGSITRSIYSVTDSAKYTAATQFTHDVNSTITLPNFNFENIDYGTISFFIKIHSFKNWSHYVFFANSFNWTGKDLDFIIIANQSNNGDTEYDSAAVNLDCCSYTYNYLVTRENWYHIVITWDAKNYLIKRYVNGALISTTDDSTNKRLDTYRSKHSSHFLGNGLNNDAYKGYFDLSDFKLYATALSADDIKELYQTSASITNNGAVISYDFTEA